ncbi:tetratricopeptide repeat-containing glycosyltransferase family 2 protein [Paenibacillus chitinolyticus]|uniref:tetratricopeptide repeat-containing glycosyltransferase family 2 protein n=1 Tax=Paenibacillus chitinolyticus TaxID=79263 RepID=UPI00366E58B8
MPTISLCMIVKNEEDHIGRCLASVADLVDEIIIVDTGSTDRTVPIVREYTDRVHHFRWIDDFAAARNYSFSLAEKEYILWLDADDVFEEPDRIKLASLIKTLEPSVDAVNMVYNLAFDEFGQVSASIRRNRLVKRSCGFLWHGPVHEYLEVGGNVRTTDIAVTHRALHHDSGRNLRIYENRLARGETFSPRDLFYFANELKDHRMYNRAIHYYEEFLGTGNGWIEDNISACGRLADCFHALGDEKRELDSVFRSFLYASPRAEFCCRLGYVFLRKKEYRTAAYWYEAALQAGKHTDSWALTHVACSTWLPHLQLCVCYDRLGEHELAHRHNETVLEYRPGDRQALANKTYLDGVLAGKEEAPAD